MNDFLLIVLFLIMAVITLPRLFSRDHSKIWSPLMFWVLYFAYYVISPCLKQENFYYAHWEEGKTIYIIASILSLISIWGGFYLQTPKSLFKHFNTQFENVKIAKVGLWLFLIGFVCYVIFKGFSLTLTYSRDSSVAKFDENASYNNPTEYLTNLISLFCLASALILIVLKKDKKRLPLFCVIVGFSVITYTIIGFRYRLLIMLVVLLCTFYLYPKPKKINWLIVAPIGIAFFIGMGIIESTRNYGKGLDLTLIEGKDVTKIEASENMSVAALSAGCINKYTDIDYILFEPIVTAVCMPIPRAIFPEKPNGYYMREANLKVFNTIQFGGAFTMFTEAYISFGWIGIILQGLFIGWISKIFWDNYNNNSGSIGAITLLAAFNGFTYVWFSRGYLAQDFTQYFYYIMIPYWIARVLCRKFQIIGE